MQQLEGFALAATGIQQHRRHRQRLAEQAAQVIDRHAQHVMLPGMAAQEPETELGFFDVVLTQVVFFDARAAHTASLAQISDNIRKRRFGSLTNGLRSSQA